MHILSRSSSFIDRARLVIAAIDAWMGHQTTGRLQVIVESIHHLSQLEGLFGMVNSIENRQMGPSLRTSFLNMVSKVARYKEAARTLYRTAKKFPIARRFEIRVVNLPENSFERVKDIPPPPTLASTLTRINGGTINTENKKSKATIRQIGRLLARGEVDTMNTQFATQRERTLKEGKIHAEIQLIYYCDQANMQPPPRVICSSKDACFLCNVFVLSHGKF